MITLTQREIVDHACTRIEEFSADMDPVEAATAYMEANPNLTPEDVIIVITVATTLADIWIKHKLLQSPTAQLPPVSDETLNAMWKGD